MKTLIHTSLVTAIQNRIIATSPSFSELRKRFLSKAGSPRFRGHQNVGSVTRKLSKTCCRRVLTCLGSTNGSFSAMLAKLNMRKSIEISSLRRSSIEQVMYRLMTPARWQKVCGGVTVGSPPLIDQLQLVEFTSDWSSLLGPFTA